MATEPNKWKDKFEAGETNLAGANFCYITLTDADFSKCNPPPRELGRPPGPKTEHVTFGGVGEVGN